jgi:hypothetical protein
MIPAVHYTTVLITLNYFDQSLYVNLHITGIKWRPQLMELLYMRPQHERRAKQRYLLITVTIWKAMIKITFVYNNSR